MIFSKYNKTTFYRSRRIILMFLATFFCFAAAGGVFGFAPMIYMFNRTTNTIMGFRADDPALILVNAPVSIPAGYDIGGLDFRPSNGKLYAFQQNNSGSQDYLITIDPRTGVVTTVGGPFGIQNSFFPSYSMSCQPAIDKIRVVNTEGANVRLDPDTGTISSTDTNLAYAPGDPHVGTTPHIGYIANSNSVEGGPTSTTYGIDTTLNTLVSFNAPPQTGQLSTVGPLGIDPNGTGGFDIQPGSNVAYLVDGAGQAAQRLWTVNLSTGQATLVGPLATTTQVIERIAVSPVNPNAFADFDRDRRTDLSIFRPSAGQWWYQRSSDNVAVGATFGTSTDKIVPADFTGDGETDRAFFRPSTGEWYVLRSQYNTYYAFPFGTNGDVPAPGDYDGDGRADAAVFRPSNSTWYISRSSGGTTFEQFGQAGDVPVAADYDGDGKTDIAIYRPSLGQWWIDRSFIGTAIGIQFGSSTDKTVPADYTGDGRTDVAFWRPSTGTWYILRSEDLTYYAFPFGSSTDIPGPGDFDGDGEADAAVFRPSNATWYVSKSTGGTLIQQFGLNGDLPLTNAFVH